MANATPPPAWDRPTKPVLSFASCDPERRFGLPSGRFTTPSAFSSFLLGVAFMGFMYGVSWFARDTGFGSIVWELLTGYSGIPIPIAALSCWSIAILLLKSLKIKAQRAALRLRFMPEEAGFALTVGSADQVMNTIEAAVDEPRQFLLLNRVLDALRSIRNIGRIGDIDEMLDSAAEADEAAMDSGYTILRGFIWAIPVLGFLGTIIGLTEAISQFGGVLDAGNASVDALTSQLTLVLAGLSTAFITTGEGLVAALLIYLAQTFVRRADELLLDDCRQYALRNVVSRVHVDGAS